MAKGGGIKVMTPAKRGDAMAVKTGGAKSGKYDFKTKGSKFC